MTVTHDVPVCDDKSSPEYRPVKEEKRELLVQLYDTMLEEIKMLIDGAKDLPTQEEVVAKGIDTRATPIPEWKWTSEEEQIALNFVADPLSRVRFLRARQWKVADAVIMMKDALRWRRTFNGKGIHMLDERTFESELKTGKGFFHGWDKWGRPVSYITARLHNGNARNLQEVEEFCVWMIENEHQKLFNRTHGVYRSCVIFDLGGFSLSNMDYQFMKFMINILQNYFPDSLGQCLILNSPWIFSTCWIALKRWIDPASQEKIKFVNQTELSNYVDVEQVPKSHGGSSDWVYNYSYPLDVFASP
jgi:hypothetical protein